MVWDSISLFAGFLSKEISLKTLIVIFEKVSLKGFLWLNMKDFEISVLTANSRNLQTAALNLLPPQLCKTLQTEMKFCNCRFSPVAFLQNTEV